MLKSFRQNWEAWSAFIAAIIILTVLAIWG